MLNTWTFIKNLCSNAHYQARETTVPVLEGNDNIYIGNLGAASESGTIRIGTALWRAAPGGLGTTEALAGKRPSHVNILEPALHTGLFLKPPLGMAYLCLDSVQ
jgi:hypothetical protein